MPSSRAASSNVAGNRAESVSAPTTETASVSQEPATAEQRIVPSGTGDGATAQSLGHAGGASPVPAMVGWGHLGNPQPVDPASIWRIRERFNIVPTTLSCASTSITGSSTDNCTVTLSAAAPSGGEVVSLASSSAAVTVPSTVTVSSKATSAVFTATVASVPSAQAATLTASINTGGAKITLQLNAAVSTLTVSATSVNFGNVATGQTASQSVILSSTGTAPVTISGITVVGSLFTAAGVTVPVTLNPGQTATLALQFTSPHVSTFTGVLTIASNSSQGNIVVNMSAAGVATAAVSRISCTSASITGAGSDACTVTLTAAPSSSLSVSLASSNTAVTVPASVTVVANATNAAFTATAVAVSSSQSATLTATGGGASATFALLLAPVVPTLSVNATSISFGSVAVNTAATQVVTLTSTGSAAVTVSSASVSGSGFTLSGATFPLTLTSGQTATLNVQFDPKASGAAAGQLTINSNSSGNGTIAIPLSGTGLTYQVALSWNAPSSSSDPVAGYKIYRALQGSSTFQLLNTSVVAQTSYTDSSPQNGANYQYYVTSVDSSGNQSVPSNEVTISIP